MSGALVKQSEVWWLWRGDCAADVLVVAGTKCPASGLHAEKKEKGHGVESCGDRSVPVWTMEKCRNLATAAHLAI